VGNVPLAAVLWNGGISFGGVIAFLFADLLILPILNIYRKYYGLKVAAILAGVLYLAMAGAALVVEALFGALRLIPAHGQVQVMQESIRWNYTSMLNLFFLAVTALLLVRFLRTGGPAMLREMGNAPADPMAAHSCCHPEPEPAAAAHDCCHPKAEVVAEIKQDCCHSEPAAMVKHDCCHAEPVAAADSAPESTHQHH
jgi:hypothetical protein